MSTSSLELLVVDAQRGTRTLLKRLLTAAGHRVYEAADLAGALGQSRGKSGPMDLLIASGRGDRLPGLPLLRAFAAEPAPLAAILLTDEEGWEPVREALSLGAVAVFRRPVAWDALLDEINRFAGRRAAGHRSGNGPRPVAPAPAV